MAGNALYVVLVDPAVANTEYDFFMLINKTLTPDQQRDPANVENFKRGRAPSRRVEQPEPDAGRRRAVELT